MNDLSTASRRPVLMGAGGGGFFFFLAHPTNTNRSERRFPDQGLVPFKIDHTGSGVFYNGS